jgi:hypothetical protein
MVAKYEGSRARKNEKGGQKEVHDPSMMSKWNGLTAMVL